MNTWKLVKLNFGRSPAHFGELGIGIEETSERVRSDTLFSAWMSAYARLFDKVEVEKLLKRFPSEKYPEQQPPFRLSSTFIYRQNATEKIYYLPRPQIFPINYPGDDGNDGGDLKFFKTYKTLHYLPLKVWHKWYQGEGFTKGDRQDLIDHTNTKNSDSLLDKAGTFDYKKAIEISQLPKIAVDRVTRATNLYHTGVVQFQWEQNGNAIKSLSGLYFLLQFSKEEENLADNLQAALHLLGEEGLGGERSSGAGRFEVEWLELPPTWRDVVKFSAGTHHTLMSLFWELPLPDSLLDNASYDIQERGGWLAESNLRRQMVRMFAEGSVFPQQPKGKLVDVTPKEFNKHRIYRSGIGLSLPIKIQDK